MLTELATKEKVDLLLQDQRPVEAKFHMKDDSSDMAYDMMIRSRRIGEDNGKDQLLHVTNYLSQIRDYVRQRVRKTTPEENARFLQQMKALKSHLLFSLFFCVPCDCSSTECIVVILG